MTARTRFVALGASTMVFACLFSGCGSYDNKPGIGGAAGSGATGGATGGSSGAATGGSGGATGGSAGAATGGSAGAATGGSAGAPTGGSSGSSGQAGSGASGAPMGGASGASGDASMGGSGGGQVACTDAAPCGGDLVGTWMAAGCELTLGGMANLSSAGIGCAEAPITGKLTVSGTWTAMANGMFTDGTTTAGEAVIELPPACLMVSGTVTDCDRVNFDSAGLLNAACVENAATDGCTCTVPINQSGGMASVSYDGSIGSASSGTYTAADNKLTTTVSSLNTEYAYCVAGSTLTMTLTTPTNAGTVTGPIVLQKQ